MRHAAIEGLVCSAAISFIVFVVLCAIMTYSVFSGVLVPGELFGDVFTWLTVFAVSLFGKVLLTRFSIDF